MRRLIQLLLAIGMVAMVACNSGDGDSNESVGGSSTGTSTESADGDSDVEASVQFDSPADGDTVSSPVALVMSGTGVTIEPAGAVAADAGHLHVMVDTDCVPAGEPIPSDDNHIHFGAEPLTERELELPPGEHTLCLQLGDGAHTAQAITDTITITVE